MSRAYRVVDVFDSIQGEGARAGTRAAFVRFAGCNQWDGLEQHRSRGPGACAAWCDTYFVANAVPLTVEQLAADLDALWPRRPGLVRSVVLTGGEPALQLDDGLVRTLHDDGWFVAVETNGTVANPALAAVDHLCVSPKLGSRLEVRQADELKIVVPGRVPSRSPSSSIEVLAPLLIAARTRGECQLVVAQDGWDVDALNQIADLGSWGRMFLAPQDGPDREANLQRALELVRAAPRFALSLQLHKILGLP